jgi:hypothetical protein
MATRLPASERTREELRDLIEGRLAERDERSALVLCPVRFTIIYRDSPDLTRLAARCDVTVSCASYTGGGYAAGPHDDRRRDVEGSVARTRSIVSALKQKTSPSWWRRPGGCSRHRRHLVAWTGKHLRLLAR